MLAQFYTASKSGNLLQNHVFSFQAQCFSFIWLQGAYTVLEETFPEDSHKVLRVLQSGCTDPWVKVMLLKPALVRFTQRRQNGASSWENRQKALVLFSTEDTVCKIRRAGSSCCCFAQ